MYIFEFYGVFDVVVGEIMELTKDQIDILDHTEHRTANGCYVGDSEDMQKLIQLGLMCYVGRTAFCPDKYFRITGAGRQAIAKAL